jgi:hypothetical protein
MPPVLRLADLGSDAVAGLLGRYGMVLEAAGPGTAIAGSYWGDSEAGLVGNRLVARSDTPLHSILHEACHYICMTRARRDGLHTDAGGDDLEECGVCYLQVLLADALPGFGRDRMLADMDAWGYSFRLGSARRWFEEDAADARDWLLREALVGCDGQPAWRLRQD